VTEYLLYKIEKSAGVLSKSIGKSEGTHPPPAPRRIEYSAAIGIANICPIDGKKLRLPFGMTRATAIWQTSELNKTTKILAVTANAFSEDRNTCLRHGFKDVLTKPFDVDQLQAMLEQHLS
jgi:DNA-binding NarL/FixJ family response regulator